jgi:hypothetical protein
MKLAFVGGFLTGAASMLVLILWVLGDREDGMVDGNSGFRGSLTEWPSG